MLLNSWINKVKSCRLSFLTLFDVVDIVCLVLSIQLKVGREQFAALFIFAGDSPSLLCPGGPHSAICSTDPAGVCACVTFGLVEHMVHRSEHGTLGRTGGSLAMDPRLSALDFVQCRVFRPRVTKQGFALEPNFPLQLESFRE